MEGRGCCMSKFHPHKHHWWGAVEGNLKGKSKSGTASFSITCKQEKWVSSLQTSLSITMTERKSSSKSREYIPLQPLERACFSSLLSAVMKNWRPFFPTEVKSFCRYADSGIIILRASSRGNIYGFNKFVRTNDSPIKHLTLSKCNL